MEGGGSSERLFLPRLQVKPEGVIALQQGGSSFSGHAGSQAEAKKFTVTVMPT